MKSVAALVLVASSANAFTPSVPSRTCVSLNAKHANNKAAKKANHDRPRKSRPSDIHRKPVVYDEIIKPPEYTVLDDGDVLDMDTEIEFEDATGFTYVEADHGTNLGMIMDASGEHAGWIAKRSGPPAQGASDAVDWTKTSQGREVGSAEEDALAWLSGQSHDDAMAWIQSKIGSDSGDKMTEEQLDQKWEEYKMRMPKDVKRSLSLGGSEDEGRALSAEELGLPEGAELIEIVDDKELVFE